MNFSRIPIVYLIVFTMLILCSCDPDKPVNPGTDLIPQADIQVKIPAFDGQSAYNFIDKQVSFGPRVPNSDGHKKTKAWLVSQFKSFGAEVIEQDFTPTTYDGTVLNATNIIARYNPKVKERVILAAHWDTRPFADKDPDSLRHQEPILGADDGGSGVGVLLEIARLLQKNPIPMGVDFILFDAEDWGEDNGNSPESYGLGSQYWAKNTHVDKAFVKYGILLDMVGAKDARFPREGYSVNEVPTITNKVWELAHKIKKDKYFVMDEGSFITDDHFFVMKYAAIPMIDIINRPTEETFGHYWHTHADNMDVIDVNTLNAVGQVVTAVIYNESNKKF